MSEMRKPLADVLSARGFTMDDVVETAAKCSTYTETALLLGVPKSTFTDWVRNYPELRDEVEGVINNERSRGDDEESSEHYLYDGEYYKFHAPSLFPNPYVLDKDTWENVCWEYAYAGEGRTTASIAMRYDIPRRILEKLIRIYRFYKHDPPYTHEMMKEAREADSLQKFVSDTLERKKHNFLVKLEKDERASLLREVTQLRSEKHNRESMISNLQSAVEELDIAAAPPSTRLITQQPVYPEPYTIHAPIADLHAGKHAWGKESYGGDYDIEESSRRVLWHGERVEDFIYRIRGVCTTLHLTDLGDTFHALIGHTEAGTPLEQDSRTYKVWSTTFEAFVARVEHLRGMTDHIHIRFAPGNHDWVLLQFFYFALAERYKDSEDVTVHVGPRWQSYFVEGTTAHILDHGKGIQRLDTPASKLSAERMTRAVMGTDYFSCRFFNYYVGHLHEMSVAMEGEHMRLQRLLPLGASDDYEAKGHYNGPAGAQIYTLDSDGMIDITRDVFIRY